jgi:hypothetical protein
MKPIAAIVLATSIMGLSAGGALADCVDTTASIDNSQKPAGISKDGTHAPLETPAQAQNKAGADTTASIDNSQKPAGISKDGTHAPLETPAQAQNKAGADTNAVDNDTAQKNGGTMPLAGEEGGGDKNLAMSQQDVEAQQQGDQTAAAKSDRDCKD